MTVPGLWESHVLLSCAVRMLVMLYGYNGGYLAFRDDVIRDRNTSDRGKLWILIAM